MANKILVKHRRGTTAEWKKWLSDPSNYLLDGELAFEDVIEPEGQPNRLRLLIGDGKWHAYETLAKIDLPGYARYSDQGAVLASGYDYAEYFQWSDDVVASDRVIGRFVTIVENTRTIRLAQPGDKVLGITTATASIVGNYSEDKQANTDWVRVGMLGIVEVEHDTTCTENGYAMVGENGKATLTNRPFGYKIVKVDTNILRPTIEIVLGNDSDMISRIKQDIADITTDLSVDFENYVTNKLANLEKLAVKDNIIIINTNGDAVPNTGMIAMTGDTSNYIKGSTAQYIFNSNQLNGRGCLINEFSGGVKLYDANKNFLCDVLFIDCLSEQAWVGSVLLEENTYYYMEFSQDTTVTLDGITFEEFCNIFDIPSSHIVKQEEAWAAPIYDIDDNLLKIGKGLITRNQNGDVESFDFIDDETQIVATIDYVDDAIGGINCYEKVDGINIGGDGTYGAIIASNGIFSNTEFNTGLYNNELWLKSGTDGSSNSKFYASLKYDGANDKLQYTGNPRIANHNLATEEYVDNTVANAGGGAKRYVHHVTYDGPGVADFYAVTLTDTPFTVGDSLPSQIHLPAVGTGTVPEVLSNIVALWANKTTTNLIQLGMSMYTEGELVIGDYEMSPSQAFDKFTDVVSEIIL